MLATAEEVRELSFVRSLRRLHNEYAVQSWELVRLSLPPKFPQPIKKGKINKKKKEIIKNKELINHLVPPKT
jgi:hypothetical protein